MGFSGHYGTSPSALFILQGDLAGVMRIVQCPSLKIKLETAVGGGKSVLSDLCTLFCGAGTATTGSNGQSNLTLLFTWTSRVKSW